MRPMFAMILSMVTGNAGRLALYAALASVLAFLWFDYQGAKADAATAKAALITANSEIADANKNVEDIVNEYATLDEQVQKERKLRQKSARLAEQRRRKLEEILGGAASNNALGHAAITDRLLIGLERIQGYKFKGREALLTARPSSDATNFCFDSRGIEAVITNIDRLGDYMEAAYPASKIKGKE